MGMIWGQTHYFRKQPNPQTERDFFPLEKPTTCGIDVLEHDVPKNSTF